MQVNPTPTTNPVPQSRYCTATKRNGDKCRQMAILGGYVCRMHGGSAPQVRALAKIRLAGLVDPAIIRMAKLIRSANGAVALGACKDVLDRNGFKPTDKLEVTGPDGLPVLQCIQVAFVSPENGSSAKSFGISDSSKSQDMELTSGGEDGKLEG